MSMSQPQQQAQQQQVKSAPGPNDLVKVRITHGRVLVARKSEDSDEDVFKTAGEVVEMKRKDYDRLCVRTFDSYHTGPDTETQLPVTKQDCPFELVS